jgi:hypothetical protein
VGGQAFGATRSLIGGGYWSCIDPPFDLLFLRSLPQSRFSLCLRLSRPLRNMAAVAVATPVVAGAEDISVAEAAATTAAATGGVLMPADTRAAIMAAPARRQACAPGPRRGEVPQNLTPGPGKATVRRQDAPGREQARGLPMETGILLRERTGKPLIPGHWPQTTSKISVPLATTDLQPTISPGAAVGVEVGAGVAGDGAVGVGEAGAGVGAGPDGTGVGAGAGDAAVGAGVRSGPGLPIGITRGSTVTTQRLTCSIHIPANREVPG